MLEQIVWETWEHHGELPLDTESLWAVLKLVHGCVQDGSLLPLLVLGPTSSSPGLTPVEPDPVSNGHH